MVGAANVVVAMDAVRPSLSRVNHRQRALLRKALQQGTTKWISPPPRMSWRTVFLVAFLNSLLVMTSLRLVFIDWLRF